MPAAGSIATCSGGAILWRAARRYPVVAVCGGGGWGACRRGAAQQGRRVAAGGLPPVLKPGLHGRPAPQVVVGNEEATDVAMKRFRREVMQAGVIPEVRQGAGRTRGCTQALSCWRMQQKQRRCVAEAGAPSAPQAPPG